MFLKYFVIFALFKIQNDFVLCTPVKIPDYIQVCKRDQNTISECVKNSIEALRPRLGNGIPELRVQGIDPLVIPELAVDQGNSVTFKAIGRDVKMYGASNFKIKSLKVDIDKLEIRSRVVFPKLTFEGKYDLDARLLVVPIHGKGDLMANATNCDAEIVYKAKLEKKNGEDYIKFTSVTTNINVDDYTLRLTNLFNGDKQLGEIANRAINENRQEFFKASKPYTERTCSSLIKKNANRIVGNFRYDDILPLP